MLRLDWNISDMHDAALIYNFYDGVEDRASDSDSNEFDLLTTSIEKAQSLKQSHETVFAMERLSSDFFISRNTMDDSQITVGPKTSLSFRSNWMVIRSTWGQTTRVRRMPLTLSRIT